MTTLDEQNLIFHVLTPQLDKGVSQTKILEAYNCWHKVWEFSFQNELGVTGQLHSDNFTSQDEITCLFYENECIAVTGIKYHNLFEKMSLDDSYFNSWPELVIARLKRDCPSVMVLNNLAISSSFRRGAYGIPWKDLVYILNILHLKDSHSHAMIGTPRIEKGLGLTAKRTGAETLMENILYKVGGAHIDLVCWKKELDLTQLEPSILKLALNIWNRSQQKEGSTHAA